MIRVFPRASIPFRPIKCRNIMAGKGRASRRRARAGVSAVQSVNGSLRVRGEEVLGAVEADSTGARIKNYLLSPGQSGMPMFDNYSKIYDRYRLEMVRITYHPSVGTTEGGTVVVGCDLDPRTSPTTMTQVLACVPKAMGPSWQKKVINVPKRQLMTRRMMFTYRDGEKTRQREDDTALVVSLVSDYTTTGANIKKLGFVMVSYVAYFEGPYSGN